MGVLFHENYIAGQWISDKDSSILVDLLQVFHVTEPVDN